MGAKWYCVPNAPPSGGGHLCHCQREVSNVVLGRIKPDQAFMVLAESAGKMHIVGIADVHLEALFFFISLLALSVDALKYLKVMSN